MRRLTPFVVALACLTGCGGGGKAGGPGPGGGGDGGGNPAPPPRGEVGTARFHVDVATGQVDVTPLGGGRAVFAGSTIGLNSSVLIDQPGDVGRKALSVSLTNHSGEPIGELPDGTVTGVKVIFGSFTNVAAFTDLRPRTQVTTIAGSGAAGSADGAAGSATFSSPSGVAAAPDGTVYITDTAFRIRTLKNGLVTTLAGNGSAGSVDGLGSAARLNQPWGIARNAVDGALIVAEYAGHKIRRVTPDGRVTTVAGTGAASSANGAGNVATFNAPMGVAVDAGGVIYIAEFAGQVLRKIVLTGADPLDPASYTVSTLAGLAATAGSTDAVGSAARFNNPAGVAVAPDGTLYVAESGNKKVRRVSPVGEVVTIAGTGSTSSTDGSGEVASFNVPRGIAWYGGALLVAETSGRRVRQVSLKNNGSASGTTATSWQVGTLAGTGAAGFVDGAGNVATFGGPTGAAVDGAGNLLVADPTNHDVRRVSPSAGFFPLGIATGAAPAEPVQLANADGVTAGSASPFIEYDGALPAVQTGPAKNWVFIVPSGVTAFEFSVTVEASTSILAPPQAVSNPGPTGAGSPNVMVRTYAGAASFGFADGTLGAARFGYLYGMAVDGAGNLFVASQETSVRRIGADGRVSTIAGILGTGTGLPIAGFGTVARFSTPIGLAVTPDGTEVFVADYGNHVVQRLVLAGGDPASAASWSASTIAGNPGVAGKTDGLGNAASFNGPFGIALDAGGNLFVTEYSGNRVRRLLYRGGDRSLNTNWMVQTVAGDTSALSGATGTTDGAGASARFYAPSGLATDRAGNLYVAEQDNHRVRKITDPAGSSPVVSTLAGGVGGDAPSWGYADGPGATARFYYPTALAVDGAGFVYVADQDNHRVRRIAPSGVVSTVAGNGASGVVDGPGDVAQLLQPYSIVVDAAGDLFVSTDNTRVRLIQRIISGN